MMPIVPLPEADATERSRLLSVNELRRQALDRLYRRREAVDDLIRSLATYSQTRTADCVELSSGQKYS